MKIPEYNRGWIDGVRYAITFVHQYARKMNDLSAKAALNTCGFSLGVQAKEHRLNVKADILERALADAGIGDGEQLTRAKEG